MLGITMEPYSIVTGKTKEECLMRLEKIKAQGRIAKVIDAEPTFHPHTSSSDKWQIRVVDKA